MLIWMICIAEPFVTKPSMVRHHYKPECHMWKMDFYLQGQGHSEGSELQWMFARTMSLIVKLSMMMHHHQPEYHSEISFSMFKVKTTIVCTRSSEILKLLQSKLVWWYIITRQGKTLWKDFLAFTQGVRQRIWLGWLWTRLLATLGYPDI